MKKVYIVIVLVLIIAGVSFFLINNKLEAPIVSEQAPIAIGDAGMLPVPPDGGVFSGDLLTGETKEFTISGKNFSFDPSSITVKKGDKVKITFNNTQGFHDFKIDKYGVATKQFNSPGTEVLEFIAYEAGSFEYYCSVGSHKAMGMKGTLKVEE